MRKITVTVDCDGRAIHFSGGAVRAVITRQVDGIASDVLVEIHSPAASLVSSVLGAKRVKCRVLADGVSASTMDVTSAEFKAPASVLSLRGGEGGFVYNEARISMAFASTATVLDVARGVASAAGLPITVAESSIKPNPPRVFSGLWRIAMTQVFGDQWTVTAAGVVCGGTAASINLTTANVHQWTGWTRERTRDGNTRRVLSCIAPYVPVDVGASCRYNNGQQSGTGVIQAVVHELSDAAQISRISIKI